MRIQGLADEEILDILEKDSQKGMVLLMEKYTGLVWHVVSFHIENPEDIKECVNDTFTGFYFQRKRFDPRRASVPVYLTAIARKVAVSRYRQERIRRGVPLDEEIFREEEGREDRRLNRAEIKMDMERAMSMLRPDELKIIRMKYYDGMTLREIAESLKLPYETVKKRHHRSILKLRKNILMVLLLLLLLLSFSACVYGVLRYLDIIPPLWGQEEEEEQEPEELPDDGLEINNDQGWRRNDPVQEPEEEDAPQEMASEVSAVSAPESVQAETADTPPSRMDAVVEGYTVSPGYGVNVNPEESVYSLTEEMTYEDEDYTLSLDEVVYINNKVTVTMTLKLKDMTTEDERYDRISMDLGSYILEYNGSRWECAGSSRYQADQSMHILYVNFENVVLPASEQGLQSLVLRMKGGAGFVFNLDSVKQDDLKSHPYQVGERGGVLAVPRLENGSLIVAIYPLDDDDGYRLLPGLVRDSFGASADECVTMAKEDGTVLTGRCLRYSPMNFKTYYEWDFGAASPGKYTLNVPALYYEQKLEDEFTISIDLKGNTWDDRKFRVPGGSVYLKECRLLSGDPDHDPDAFEEFYGFPYPDMGDKGGEKSKMDCRSLKIGFVSDDPEFLLIGAYGIDGETDQNPEPFPEDEEYMAKFEKDIKLAMISNDIPNQTTNYLLKTNREKEYVENAYLRFRRGDIVNYRWDQSFDIPLIVNQN